MASENADGGSSASLVPSQALSSSGGGRQGGRRNRRRGTKKPTDGAILSNNNGGGDDNRRSNKADEAAKQAIKMKEPIQHNSNVKGGAEQEQDNRTKHPQPKKKNKQSKRKGKQKRKKYPWRRHIPPGSMDPITLENLVSLPYPPFALAATEPYVPIPEWPVVVPDKDEEQVSSEAIESDKQDTKLSPEEWQRRVMEEQWGHTTALPDNQKDEPSPRNTKEQKEGHISRLLQHVNLFDGRALAYYLVSQLQFIDPFNRRDLTREELVNLDAYLARHGFSNDLNVTEAYEAKGVTLSKAGAMGNTAAGRAAILQQEAQSLLANMFVGSNPLQQQYAESQRQQQRRPPANSNGNRRSHRPETEDSGIYGTEDGGFMVIDDDANPGLRGQRVRNMDLSSSEGPVPRQVSSAVPNTLWSASHIHPNLSHSARTQALNFPALPTPTTDDSESSAKREQGVPPAKGPSKSLQRITKVVVPTDPAELKRQREAREEAQRRAMMANLNFMAQGAETVGMPSTSATPGLIPVPAPATSREPTSGQILRNQAMASALGVVPSTVRQQQLNAGWARPNEGELALDAFGNELNAAVYPDSLIMEARERMDNVLKIERKWKTFLADDKSASLPLRPMDRELRTFIHHYSDFWKLHTESFDHGPKKRYINCVKLKDTRAPVPLLSDVARRWRGPAPVILPRGPRETTEFQERIPQQAAGQATSSREFPPAPPREPLKLKPRTTPIVNATAGASEVVDNSVKTDEEAQVSTRFEGLFSGRERPKLSLAPRTVPRELPPYQPPKSYDVSEERVRQQATIAEKARREREEEERKAKILAYAFASSDEESLASAGGSSDWGEEEQQYSGSDDSEHE